MVYNLTSENNTMTLLYLYLGSGWWKEKKRAWFLLFAHVCNYPLLNTCSGNSGRGRGHTYPQYDILFSKYATIVVCSEE